MSTQKETKKAKLYLAEPVEFDGTSESKFLTTVSICKYINELMRGAFVDYVGCTVTPNVNNSTGICGEPVTLDLYFAPNSDNGKGASIRAFCPVGTDSNKEPVTPTKNNYVGMALQHNTRVTTTSTMQITQNAVDMLYDLLIYGLRNGVKPEPKSFSAKGLAVETADAGQYGNPKPYVYNIIRGVDINAIMKIIFGDKQNNFEFQVTPIKPVLATQSTNGTLDSKWLFLISKLDKNDFNDLMNELGFYNKTSNLGIVTATF